MSDYAAITIPRLHLTCSGERLEAGATFLLRDWWLLLLDVARRQLSHESPDVTASRIVWGKWLDLCAAAAPWSAKDHIPSTKWFRALPPGGRADVLAAAPGYVHWPVFRGGVTRTHVVGCGVLTRHSFPRHWTSV